mgnify:CR=1 FL=1
MKNEVVAEEEDESSYTESDESEDVPILDVKQDEVLEELLENPEARKIYT